jgi:hypothetical protein
MDDQKFIIPLFTIELRRASEDTLSRWSRLHLQSLASTNPHWARIHKEALCPSSGGINRMMMMMKLTCFKKLRY